MVVAIYVGRVGDEPARRVTSAASEIQIGSAADNDLVLAGLGVAPHHCRVVVRTRKQVQRLSLLRIRPGMAPG